MMSKLLGRLNFIGYRHSLMHEELASTHGGLMDLWILRSWYIGCRFTTPHASAYSMSPLASILPRLTFSPFSRRISSTVRSWPPFVLSLNQPRWSAIKCLEKAHESTHRLSERVWCTCFCILGTGPRRSLARRHAL